MFLLRHGSVAGAVVDVLNLHSNMFLLRRYPDNSGLSQSMIFTFQYVSIKTCAKIVKQHRFFIFTFQYVSIKTLWATTAL